MASPRETANPRASAAKPSLELSLSHDAFVTGRPLSGVVTLRLPRPVNVRSIEVGVTGSEKPAGATLTRGLSRRGAFFHREALLSGRDRPRLTSDRVSHMWNALLGRDTGRRLSAGEHIYPFSIPLPASLPPSYEGRAGRIDYRVTARVQFPAGGGIKAASEVPIRLAPRAHRPRPVALSYPTAGGDVHSTEIEVSLQLAQCSVRTGGSLEGVFSIQNPQGVEIPGITVALEMCEWVRLAAERELHRDRVDIHAVTPESVTAPEISGEFELRVPESACPTVEGTAISVIWLLKLTLETAPPIELKTPITVYGPVVEGG